MTQNNEPAADYIDAMATIERQVSIARRAAKRSGLEGEQLESLIGVLDEMEMVSSDLKTACNSSTASSDKDQTAE